MFRRCFPAESPARTGKSAEMSDEQVVQRVKRVIEILEKADVPTDIRGAAFESVWKSVVAEATPSAGSTPAVTAAAQPREGVQALASKLGVEVELVGEIFEQQEDGTFTVQVPTSKLAATKAAGTKELALLVCAARQYGVEEWTDSDQIRVVCHLYGKFDSNNNASIMAEGDKYWMISGKGRSRKYKLRRTGWEEAGNLVRRLMSS